MKILFLNNADIEGGAARGATRLLEGIRAQGADARLCVQRKFGNSPFVIGPHTFLGKAMGFARPTLEQAIFNISPRKTHGPFSPSFIPDGLPSKVAEIGPDIVHLHWVANMMRLETLRRFIVPVVWTMHDSWAFTGGCYIPSDCTRYQDECGRCPVLGSCRKNDLSHRVWRRKQKAWNSLNLTIVAPSRWIGDCAKASSLFHSSRIEVIPNAIDVERYKPLDKRMAREIYSLPHDKKLVLFGAKSATKDRNKGFHLLARALQELSDSGWRDSVEVVFFGSSEPEQQQNFGLKTHYLGWLSDDISLALLYSAADVFVFPSLQESLGYTAMESMACNTPCVAFRQGGVPDLIDHQQNGYLAHPFEPSDLARGIAWILEDNERRSALAVRARQKVVQEFAVKKIAEQHMALYREILRGNVRA